MFVKTYTSVIKKISLNDKLRRTTNKLKQSQGPGMAEIVNVATFKQILLTHTTKCTLSITLDETGHWQIPHPLNLQGFKLRRRHEHETCTRFEVLGFRIVHMELIVSGVNGEGGIFIVEAAFRGHELSMIYILSGVWYVSTLLWGVQQVSVGRGLCT